MADWLIDELNNFDPSSGLFKLWFPALSDYIRAKINFSGLVR